MQSKEIVSSFSLSAWPSKVTKSKYDKVKFHYTEVQYSETWADKDKWDSFSVKR